MESKYSLYIATNVLNGKQYVGLSKEYKKRLISHKCARSKSVFHQAIKQYGFENFIFSHIADAFDLEAACNLERVLIQQHNTLFPNGYNLTIGGQIGPVNYKHSDEIKKKISEFNRSRSPEIKEKFRLAKKGTKQTEAFRLNASIKMKEVWAKRRAAKEEAQKIIANISIKENCNGQ